MSNKWKLYEKEKRKLQKMNLTPEEYKRNIKLLCERLMI